MPLKISKCEVDKENQISSHFRVIILANQSQYSEDVLATLQSFANHFDDLSIGYYFYQNHIDLVAILNNGQQHNILFIVIDVFANLLKSTKSLFEEVTIFSNTINVKDFDYSIVNFLGFQRHLVDIVDISKVESESNFAASLGLLTSDINKQEPELREQKHLMVDLNVCKQCYFKNVKDALPTGIEPETLIQLVRFSTNSPFLKTIVFNIGNIDLSSSNIAESTMMAECIWYTLEGIKAGPNVIDEHCETTFCTLKEHDIDLEFIYSPIAHKYWARVFEQAEINSYVPCSESEYIEGCQGQISNRLFNKLFNH
jgi:hypothetical protein